MKYYSKMASNMMDNENPNGIRVLCPNCNTSKPFVPTGFAMKTSIHTVRCQTCHTEFFVTLKSMVSDVTTYNPEENKL